MSSRDKEQTMIHHDHHNKPLLRSLVIRPSHSDAGSDAPSTESKPVEIQRNPLTLLYSRSHRFAEYRPRGNSMSPVRLLNIKRCHNPNFDRRGAPLRSRIYGEGRISNRYHDSSPVYGRGSVDIKPLARDTDGYRLARRARGENMPKHTSNARPTERNWICPNCLCGNLNFARSNTCKKCKRFRYTPNGSPRRNYPHPKPPLSRRLPSPPIDRSFERVVTEYRSTPRGSSMKGSRDYRPSGLSPPKHDVRSYNQMWRDQRYFSNFDYRRRSELDRLENKRDRDRYTYAECKMERKFPSPSLRLPPLPSRDRWALDARDRSRSPIRDGRGSKDYSRDMYFKYGRDQAGH